MQRQATYPIARSPYAVAREAREDARIAEIERRKAARKRERERIMADLGIEPMHPVVKFGIGMMIAQAVVLLFFAI
ncbi:hypothetical protein [Aquibium microcysteis]|uniref:hypothetical protein n=1 Tax=Aquibium microcysteis TaxID=675281 RepID=UPI00165D1A4C|nr:hypothetical protein [Aquibium microcysteis]